MREWVEGLVGPDLALPTIAAAAAVIALFVLLLLWRLFRGGSASGTYVAGGRNRKARLAVMDATAIDNYRRLVLVRRDDVEHLLLIGGSADVVVESNIRLGGMPTRSAPEPVYDQPEAEPVAPPPPPVLRSPPPAPRQAPPPPARQQPARVEPKATYIAPRQQTPRISATQQPSNAQAIDDAFDDDLLRELEVELDAEPQAVRGQKRAAPSLDDEMSKLLGELAPDKR